MASSKEIVYWDSCVFIDLLSQQKADRFAACKHIQERAEKGEVTIVTSAITITEVMKLGSAPATDKENKQILDYFENPYIIIRQVDRATAMEAREVIRKHGLRTVDAIHVATALRAGVPVVQTYDGIKGRRKGLLKYNLKIGNPPIRIETPPAPPPPPASIAPLIDAIEKAEAERLRRCLLFSP
ncbi:MAG: type II toxin-antitoxin system VapC family toxin [Gemmatales bacterium]